MGVVGVIMKEIKRFENILIRNIACNNCFTRFKNVLITNAKIEKAVKSIARKIEKEGRFGGYILNTHGWEIVDSTFSKEYSSTVRDWICIAADFMDSEKQRFVTILRKENYVYISLTSE